MDDAGLPVPVFIVYDVHYTVHYFVPVYDFDTAAAPTSLCLSPAAGIHTYEGSDEPWASDGRPSENTFDNNIISNTEVGVNLRQGDSNVFTSERRKSQSSTLCVRVCVEYSVNYRRPGPVMLFCATYVHPLNVSVKKERPDTSSLFRLQL